MNNTPELLLIDTDFEAKAEEVITTELIMLESALELADFDRDHIEGVVDSAESMFSVLLYPPLTESEIIFTVKRVTGALMLSSGLHFSNEVH